MVVGPDNLQDDLARQAERIANLEQQVAALERENLALRQAGRQQAEDVTGRQRAEEALRESEERLRVFFEGSPDGMAVVDRELRHVVVNKEFARIHGISVESHIGKTIREVVPGIADALDPILRRVLETGETVRNIETPSSSAGAPAQAKIATCFPLFEKGSLPSGIGVIVVDITERKKVDDKLRAYQEELRLLASALAQSEERERRRLANMLHDNVSQILALTKIKVDSLLNQAVGTPQEEPLAEIRRFCEQVIEVTRSLTAELSPPLLFELGLEPALGWLAEHFSKLLGIQILFEDDGQLKPISDDLRMAMFQATRELLVNVGKHAQANHARISARRMGDRAVIEVSDDGIGLSPAAGDSGQKGQQGLGLFGIRERLDPLGGRLMVISTPGRGTQVSIIGPVLAGGKS